jgi:NADPH:quinone reductase-like Zn-dependent oxidoreductase
VVLDTIGGSMWEHYMKGLRAGGRLVTCSLTTGRDPKLDLVAILSKQLTIYGTGGSGSKSAVATVVKLINERRLLGVVDRIMDLKSADQAHDLIQNRAISGKVVLKP